MILNNVGFDHRHDADFFIDRPEGSGDNLLLILKTDAIFTLNGSDVFVPRNSFFLYPKGMPQFYRCVPQQPFANDWMHFLFEGDEETQLRAKGIPFAEPVSLRHTEFYSYCIRAIADENSAQRLHSADSVRCYFELICNKVSEQIRENQTVAPGSRYEMLLTVRNAVYANPFWEWSVNWGAHQTRMSISSFHAHYKAQFGVTFMQDVITARIRYAQMLLRTTDMSVHDIGMQCGYRSYEHFARQFKRECGVSPGAFRANG
jgi:AraC family transcriptional regulator of arabinose operon